MRDNETIQEENVEDMAQRLLDGTRGEAAERLTRAGAELQEALEEILHVGPEGYDETVEADLVRHLADALWEVAYAKRDITVNFQEFDEHGLEIAESFKAATAGEEDAA